MRPSAFSRAPAATRITTICVRTRFDGGFDAILANESDFLATRVAYKLDLKGPSLSIQTSCSTSLVAVHVACQQLLTQQCDIAVAGGVFLDRLPVTGYLWQPGSILSSDGHCRAFDARADGAIAGRGVGVVVLNGSMKPSATAMPFAPSFAVRRSITTAPTKVSYAAPSVAGQAEVIAKHLPSRVFRPTPSASSRRMEQERRWEIPLRSRP